MKNVVVTVLLPRNADEGAGKTAQLCTESGGSAQWNNSGKGNRRGVLTCTFPSKQSAANFVRALMEAGFRIEASSI